VCELAYPVSLYQCTALSSLTNTICTSQGGMRDQQSIIQEFVAQLVAELEEGTLSNSIQREQRR